MLFSSSVFLFLFLPIVLFIYYVLLKKRLYRNLFLVLSSLGFYAWGEPWFVFVMIASIIVNWFSGLLVDKYRDNKTKSRLIVVSMLIFNFSVMFIFKYLMFTLQNINNVFNAAIPVPAIVLPIGISFFTFQAVSYVLDVYRKDGEVQRNIFNVALYISLFPQLIAGPIVRYQTIAEQINNRNENIDDFSEGVRRFIIGLAKKVIIANNMAVVADKAFSIPTGELSVAFAWIGALAYSFQIFFDFSGYSDMGIGLGKMFGFHFLENFNYPYISKSISEFWRRWHISLSTWFRDYVYFPMGGSRVSSKQRLVFNLFVVWSLTGIWHGANWTFAVWGIFYFVLITAEKLTDFETRIKQFGLLKRLYVLTAVLIGWVIFRSDSITHAFEYLEVMFGISGNLIIDSNAARYFVDNIAFYLFAAVFSAPSATWLSARLSGKKTVRVLYPAAAVILLLVSISYIVKGSYNPFIYFNF